MVREPIDIKISDRFQNEVEGLYKRIDDSQMLGVLGDVLYSSVQQNFEVGGRPRWAPLAQQTIDERTKARHYFEDDSGRSMQILVRSGDLRNSVFYKVRNDTLILGEKKIYAAVHHFGAKKGEFGTFDVDVKEHERTRNGKTYTVRAHTRRQALPWGDIPARPSLIVQDADWDVALEGIKDFILA